MIYICNICGKSFDSKQKLGGHKNSHKIYNNEDLICDVCGKICKGNQALTQHITRVHSESESRHASNSEFNLLQDDLFCQYCGRQCKNKNSLVNHERLCKLNLTMIIILHFLFQDAIL